MRLSALLLVSSMLLSLTGCCLSIDGGRDSGFQSSRHGDGCQCPQHTRVSNKPSSSKTIRPVRKTRPLFAGDRWKDRSNTLPGSYDFCAVDSCVCGGVACGGMGTCGGGCGNCGPGSVCGDLGSCGVCSSSDCSGPAPVWGADTGCHSPSWVSDSGCSSPAFPHSQFLQSDPGFHAPYGMSPPTSMHGPGCGCGQHGGQGHPEVHGQPMHPVHPVHPNPPPGSSMPAQPRQHGPVEHFSAPAEPVRPMPVPPAETPVPMPMPDVGPAPAPATPVEQTSWEVPVFPPIP